MHIPEITRRHYEELQQTQNSDHQIHDPYDLDVNVVVNSNVDNIPAPTRIGCSKVNQCR